jgi:Ni/Fe-hydrogenase subunit HybB-like protein
MTAIAHPDEPRRPNIASADIQLPAVKDYEQVDREILAILEPTKAWFGGLLLAIACLAFGAASWAYQIHQGLGVAGYNPPVMWGVYIITFVFWVGIGHAGTLISAILYLFRAGFRTTIYRAAEAMTVFAVMTAGLFPIIHIGRPWKFFWLIPYPNWRLIWPNFKSPLVWDVFAITTYLTISTTFLFVGPDPRHRGAARPRDQPAAQADPLGAELRLAQLGAGVAALRPRVPVPRRLLDAAGALGALGRVLRLRDGHRAGLAHDDLPALLRRRRHLLRLRDGLDDHHPDAEVVRAQALRHAQPPRRLGEDGALHVAGRRLAYMIEFFIAWYGGVPAEQDYFWNRVFGQWWWAAWIMLTCNMILPLSLFSQKLRRNPTWLFILSIFINIGMWFERFVIVVPSLSHDMEPWQWSSYVPTWVDYGLLIGSFGWFFMWFLLFVKQLPVMALAEIKEIVPPKMKRGHSHHGGH